MGEVYKESSKGYGNIKVGKKDLTEFFSVFNIEKSWKNGTYQDCYPSAETIIFTNLAYHFGEKIGFVRDFVPQLSRLYSRSWIDRNTANGDTTAIKIQVVKEGKNTSYIFCACDEHLDLRPGMYSQKNIFFKVNDKDMQNIIAILKSLENSGYFFDYFPDSNTNFIASFDKLKDEHVSFINASIDTRLGYLVKNDESSTKELLDRTNQKIKALERSFYNDER